MMSVFAVPREEDGSYFDTTIVVADVMVDGTISDVRETRQAESRDLSFEKRRLLDRTEIPAYYEEVYGTVLSQFDAIMKQKRDVKVEVMFKRSGKKEGEENAVDEGDWKSYVYHWYISEIRLWVEGTGKAMEAEMMTEILDLMGMREFKKNQKMPWDRLNMDLLFQYLTEELNTSGRMRGKQLMEQNAQQMNEEHEIIYRLSNKSNFGIGKRCDEWVRMK